MSDDVKEGGVNNHSDAKLYQYNPGDSWESPKVHLHQSQST